ncbi:MAG: hypothetical protein KF906_10270 [Actinobacteria bacterium]|nr:hypothetical protein [Actinomycetota bacterium]
MKLPAAEKHDIDVDLMDMTDDRRLWVRTSDVRHGFDPAIGRYAVVGDDDADQRVARIEDIADDGLIRLEVLPGPFEDHRGILERG